jgi:ABC-type Zn uptake system ZnuABC Zn-binding protein ZnuA
MKFLSVILAVLLLCGSLFGCVPANQAADIAATTLPVYTFTSALCQGTGLMVTQLVTENVSCLHDYSLSISQVKAVEAADLVIISGGGLEDFMAELLSGKSIIDSSESITLSDSCHEHEGHSHDHDPHFWLSPEHAKTMARNICAGLSAQYPAHADAFETNLQPLLTKLDALQAYGTEQLRHLSCRELITFHDGFSYFAHSFGLEILKAVEEESGSEASASELKELITLVRTHNLPAIFTEANGSTSAAQVISAETGIQIYTLNMAMSGDYFETMKLNIDTMKEALG